MAEVSARLQRRLKVAHRDGDLPYHKGSGDALYVGAGRPAMLLRRADGRVTPAGREYLRLVHEAGPREGEHLELFDPGERVVVKKRQEFATDRRGQSALLRTYQPATDGYRYTKRGIHFYGHDQQRFVVHMPVIVHYKRPEGYSKGYREDRDGEPFTIPLDEETLKNGGAKLNHKELLDLQVSRLHPDIDKMQAFIKEAILAFLRQKAEKNDNMWAWREGEKPELQVAVASDAIYTVDPETIGNFQGWKFDMLSTAERAREPPRTEAILNRPLRGRILAPDSLWNKMGLAPQAWIDYAAQGKNCVAQQLAVCVRTWRGVESKEAEPLLDIGSVEALLDDIFEDLYPGRFRGEQEREEPEAQRAEELRRFAEGWKQWFPLGKRRTLQEMLARVNKGNFSRCDPELKGFHAALERAFSGELLDRYRQFVRSFPDVFKLLPDDAVMGSWQWYEPLTQEEEEDLREQRRMVRDKPYEERGWRDVGVTSHMVLELCRRLSRRARIIHNDRCIYDFTPEGYEEERACMVVFSVWGDHCMFYRDTRGASCMPVQSVKEVPEFKLVVRQDYDRTPFDEMRPWTPEAFSRAYKKQESVVFKAECLQPCTRFLREQRHSFHCKFRNTHAAAQVRVKMQNGVICVRAVSARADYLKRLCAAYAQRYGRPFVYYGEELGTIATRLMEALLSSHRPAGVDRYAVARAQEFRCALCGDMLASFEVDHEQPLKHGGGDGENLRALCVPCHARETQRLHQSGLTGRHSFYSELSPEMTELWLNTPKPPQQVNGIGTRKRKGEEVVPCLDIKGCRSNALLLSHRLPVFGPADAPQKYQPPLDQWDYLWLDRGFLRDDRTDLSVYDGPHLYSLFATQYLLDLGVIGEDCIRLGLRASRQIAQGELCMALVELAKIVQMAAPDPKVLRKLQKEATLAWIGVCNRVASYEYVVNSSTCVEDVGGGVTVYDLDGDKVPAHKTETRLLDSRTAFPIGLLALQREACWVDYAERQLRSLGCTVLGTLVDGVFFEEKYRELVLERLVREHQNGVTFDLKDEPACKVPACQQRRPNNAREAPTLPSQIVVLETDIARIDRLYREAFTEPAEDPLLRLARVACWWGSCAITGVAGVGKTSFLQLILREWRALEPEAVFILGALTHVAARQMGAGASTIAHLLHKYKHGCPKNAVFVLDEISQVPLSTLAIVGRWKHLGARFVLIGDMEGQFLPILDGWAGRGSTVANADILLQLAKRLHIRLEVNRRCSSDPGHFDFYKSLYYSVDLPEPLPAALAQAGRRYPWNGQWSDGIVLVLSHEKRRRVNAFLNLPDRAGGTLVKSVGAVKWATSHPQDMWLRPGMRLLGCAGEHRKIVNGAEYIVKDIQKDRVVVDMEAQFRTDRQGETDIALTHGEASSWLRLRYACCYYPIQGRTLREPLLLLDSGGQHFTLRHLIVGLSRVTCGSLVHLPTPQQEAAFLRSMPAIPEESPMREELCCWSDEPDL